MQMQRENAKQYIILREFYLQQMRIFVTQNRMDLAFFGYATSQNHTKIYQKCIRRRVRAVLTQQIFSSPKAFLAGHIGNMSGEKRCRNRENLPVKTNLVRLPFGYAAGRVSSAIGDSAVERMSLPVTIKIQE